MGSTPATLVQVGSVVVLDCVVASTRADDVKTANCVVGIIIALQNNLLKKRVLIAIYLVV